MILCAIILFLPIFCKYFHALSMVFSALFCITMSLLLFFTCEKIRIHRHIKRLTLHYSGMLFYLSRVKFSCFLRSFWKTTFFPVPKRHHITISEFTSSVNFEKYMPNYIFQPAHAFETWRLCFKFSFPIIHLYTQHVVDDCKLFISLKNIFFSYNRSFHYFDIDTTIIEYHLCREQCRTLYGKTSILIITQYQMLFELVCLVRISLIILNKCENVFISANVVLIFSTEINS